MKKIDFGTNPDGKPEAAFVAFFNYCYYKTIKIKKSAQPRLYYPGI